MKRTSVTSEDSPLSPEQIEAYLQSLSEFYSNADSEEKTLSELFKLYDRNGDGKISVRELSVLLRAVCPEDLADNEIEKILKTADINNDSTIDFNEFCEMMRKYKKDS